MSGRRILVVLDNARDAAQVRPLLPGSATALVVATSRDRLLPLVAAEGAVPIAVDLPSAVDARRMLVGRAGPSWAGVDPDAAPAAVDEIVARCARLPLALTVAAARAATGPGGGPDQLAEELRSAAGSLDAFDVGDPGGDVRAVFFWSYATLSEPAARLFRQLGVHPGPDVSAAAAAALAGAPPAAVRGLLRELTRASLLTEHRPGRFACHDLLRTYADELAAEVRAEGNAALHRVLDHYLHTAHAATLTLNPSWEPLPLDAPAPGSAPTPPADTERALAWYSAELSVLVAAVNQAHAAGLDTLAWRLAWTLTDPLEREGEWVRWADVHRIGLSAARRLGDRLAQAQLHRGLGRVSMWQGHYEDATDQFHRALRLFTEVDHVAGQARVWHNLCQMYDLRGDHAAALDCGRQSLRLSRQTGDRAAIAKELNAVGWCLAGLGDLTPALRHCEEALELWQQVHDTAQEAATWDSVGYIHHQRGQFEAAVACFRRGAALNQEVGDRFHAAHAMVHSGDSLLALNEPAQARQAWREAEQILADLAHPWRSDVAARLTALDRPAP